MDHRQVDRYPEASFQRQITPQAGAPSSGQPRPISRLGRALQALISTQFQHPTPATLSTASRKRGRSRRAGRDARAAQRAMTTTRAQGCAASVGPVPSWSTPGR
eukprot:scaffold35845_cov77-Phaeocystis_antarctica.AAC.1